MLQAIGEEDAIVWLWASPSLLPWPRQVAWLFSPVTGKERWPGDLWGVDSGGQLIILENKLGSGKDPFEDFVGYHRSRRPEVLAVSLREKWRKHYRAESQFPDTFIERGRKTNGVLPRSSKRAPIRRWPELAASIDAGIRMDWYGERVNDFLAARESRNNPSPHYCGLFVALEAREPRLSERARHSMQAVRSEAGADRVHLFVARARFLGRDASRRVEISVEERS